MSFKQIAKLKGRNGMQKKRMKIKSTLNFKIILMSTANLSKIQKSIMPKLYFELTFRKCDSFYLNGQYIMENNVNSTKMYF